MKSHPQSDRYSDVLKVALQRRVAGIDVKIIDAGISAAESARGAVERLKVTVDLDGPDLALWHVGLGDVFARSPVDTFLAATMEAIGWLKKRDLDILVIDLPYVRGLHSNAPYQTIRAAAANIARAEGLAWISSYDITEGIEQSTSTISRRSANPFVLLPKACLCTAELVAQAIASTVASITPSSHAWRN